MTLNLTRTQDRRRIKKKLHENMASNDFMSAGGYTIQHEDNGDIKILSPKHIEKPKKSKLEKIELIFCQNFDKFQAPFAVRLHLDALIVMDFHSHLSHIEVIGLIGGYFDEEDNILHLTKSVPCRSTSTRVHCDMCPVSQSEANIKLQAEGLDVVGWYHSHPTFMPEPSGQDLSTQKSMQNYFEGAPFVSFILSPYFREDSELISSFRCLIVKNSDPSDIPFSLDVSITGESLNLPDLFEQIDEIYKETSSLNAHKVKLDAAYAPGISYSVKYLLSTKEHLKRSISLSDSDKEAILTKLKTLLK